MNRLNWSTHLSLPLFDAFPGLEQAFAHTSLGTFPTPVDQCPALAQAVGLEDLWIKRDDVSGNAYGGNKVRKLEFLLAEAKKRGCQDVITFGFAGSNHALCTAYYAKQLGLQSHSMLMPQPNAYVVRENLLLGAHVGADLLAFPDFDTAVAASKKLARRIADETGHRPMIIPGGGSSALGSVGFVNAVFELQRQIEAGELPQPDVIYIAVGSMGSTAGLLVGLRLLNMPTRLEGIRVTDASYATPKYGAELAEKTLTLLRQADSSVPTFTLSSEDYPARDGFFGERYGLYTAESAQAIMAMETHTGIRIEGTYTGKAFAALIHDAQAGKLADKKVLFWNTYNSWVFSDEICDADYRALPSIFHKYFEEDVQPLADRQDS
jgi:D-cysteine desulfhydrase